MASLGIMVVCRYITLDKDISTKIHFTKSFEDDFIEL